MAPNRAEQNRRAKTPTPPVDILAAGTAAPVVVEAVALVPVAVPVPEVEAVPVVVAAVPVAVLPLLPVLAVPVLVVVVLRTPVAVAVSGLLQ
jgi:hypothetical protein